MSNNTVTVPKAWLEGLVKRSLQINRGVGSIKLNGSKQEVVFLADLAQLQGYIESASYLLEEEKLE